MLNFDTTSTTGKLTINTVSMHCAAWCMLNCLPLWGFDRQVRLHNVIVPEVTGTTGKAAFMGEARHALEMAITGDCDRLGVRSSTPWTQLEENIEYLMVNVVNPPAAPTATRAATLLMPSGEVRTADVQVISLDRGVNVGYTMRAVLNLMIPAGVFAPVEGS